MTPDELRAIRDAATPGPWSWNEARFGTREWLQVGPPVPSSAIADLSLGHEADAALIALAPELASLLADAIEALERADSYLFNTPLEGALDRWGEVRDVLARFQALREPE